MEFEHEKEARKAAAEKQQIEIEKNVDISKIRQCFNTSILYLDHIVLQIMMDQD